MREIALHGYFGYDNIGDEAILHSIIEGIKSSEEESSITVFSSSPKKTSRRYGVKAVSRHNFCRIIRTLRNSHLFISGGGSLLQDVTSFHSPIYYLLVMRLAARFSEKAAFAFQGFGPLKNSLLQKCTVNTLKKLDEVSVRDEDSYRKLIHLGLPEKSVNRVYDPVFLQTPEDSGLNSKKSDSNSNFPRNNYEYNLGVAVRPWGNSEYLNEVAKSVSQFLRENPEFKLTFLPLHYDSDIKSARFVKDQLKDCENSRITMISPIEHPGEITTIFSRLDLLLGVRLHSLIFATMMGVPCVGIEYDPKIPAFLSQLDLEPAGKTGEITAHKIYSYLNCYWNRSKNISRKQREYSLACKREIEGYLSRLLQE